MNGKEINKSFLTLRALVGNISVIGLDDEMDRHTYLKGYASNQINIAGMTGGVARVVYLLFSPYKISTGLFLLNLSPLLACSMLMLMMGLYSRRTAITFLFTVFPVLICAISVLCNDRGAVLYFAAFFIYPFFFLDKREKIVIGFLFIVVLLVVSLFSPVIFALNQNIPKDFGLEITSIAGAIFLFFVTLISISQQIYQYEGKVKQQNNELERVNQEVTLQKDRIYKSNQTKQKLFSIISHDLRIPIQALLLLLSDEKNREEGCRLLVNNLPSLREELQSTEDLLNNLFFCTYIQQGPTIKNELSVSVSESVDKVLKYLKTSLRNKEIRIERHVASDLMVSTDDCIFEIVLRNIVSNAVKFTPKGGVIVIAAAKTGNSILLQVTDSGKGMTKEVMAKIIKREMISQPGTDKEKGTGMGLLICRDLIEQAGGYFTIQNLPGHGAVVDIILPCGNKPFQDPQIPSQAFITTLFNLN